MAKPKLALIPAAQGDKFYSVLPSDGVGDFTFARASTGTRIAPTGLIEEVASGDSRLNYDLLNGKVVNCPHYLLEPASTNSVTYSENFSQWQLIGITVTSNSLISPDGSLNASKLVATSGSSNKVIAQGITPNTYTASVFAKKGEFEGLFIGTGTTGAFFNLNTYAYRTHYVNPPTSFKIENYGNGWYRYSITFTQSANDNLYIGVNDNVSNTLAVTGNGTSGIYTFGAQIEALTYSTSYIPTNGTAITRAAESANGSGDASTFNDSEGVLMAEISALADDLTFRLISLSDGTSNNRIYLGFNNTTNTIYLVSEVGGLTQVLITYAVTNITDFMKLAVKYKVNDYSLYFNGFEVATDTSRNSTNRFKYTCNLTDGAGFSTFYGNTRELQYFDSALTDAQLETLTSWTSLQEMITSQLYTNY